MNQLDKRYIDLLQDILDNGVRKEDRTGTGTISVFGRQIRHKMSDGFPLLTTKKMPFRLIVTELIWFLRGDTNIKFLVDNDCHIWDGDAYRNYEILMMGNPPERILDKDDFIQKIKEDAEIEHSPFTFAQKWGELGPVYGRQWRKWDIKPDIETKSYIHKGETHFTFDINERPSIDQIANLINELKTNPDSRRLMVNSWNVGELDSMVLPPCHYGFQVYTRELSLEERLLLADKINKEIRQDLYSYVFNNPIYTGGIDQRPDDVERHDLLSDLNIPTRAISLMWNQRSVDTFLGLPFNIASYGLLLEIIAKEVNMVPDELIGNLGDTHLYLNHIEQAKEQIGRELSLEERKEIYEKEYTDGMKVQNDEWLESKLKTRDIPTRTREPYPLPKLLCLDEYHYLMDKELVGEIPFVEKIEKFRPDFFTLENYQSHPAIKAPLSN
jgi:thymidylate synthase